MPAIDQTKPYSEQIICDLFEGLRSEISPEASWVELGQALDISPNRFSQWRNGRGMYIDRLNSIISKWNESSERRNVSLVLSGNACSLQWGQRP